MKGCYFVLSLRVPQKPFWLEPALLLLTGWRPGTIAQNGRGLRVSQVTNGCGQNQTGEVTQVLVHVSAYQSSTLVPVV